MENLVTEKVAWCYWIRKMKLKKGRRKLGPFGNRISINIMTKFSEKI